ncbi:MAG: 3-isopropylmalate dehydratase large subunit [uncultured Gemmatimonadaceae bacterium]|uniref:3-isopropylmalate dehydratase large subunit n=1 Tax=uncultured Gemmatimonadaceae bacterium TaxID=246130 RepID=A0A6J4LTG0_9BACT|nr:MAG: 3-isopropylmalate dehydratase large subunit [uncultured Gemmatimonadaceae bacterium]
MAHDARDAVRLDGRVLFLTDDAGLVDRQLAGEDLHFDPAAPPGAPGALPLRHDVSTDEITPAYICYYYDQTLGDFPYLGLRAGDRFPVARGAVRAGGFAVSVAGRRRGKGSSREASPYAERAAGIRLVIGESLERIYRENCQNLGVLTSTDLGLVRRVRGGEAIPLAEFTRGEGPIGAEVVRRGGLFAYNAARARGDVAVPLPAPDPRPMTLAERIIARHWVRGAGLEDGVPSVRPGDEGFVRTDLRFSHEYVTPMAAALLREFAGPDARVAEPSTVLLFRDHLTLLDEAMRSEHVAMGLLDAALALEAEQRAFAEAQGVRLYGERGRRRGAHGGEAAAGSEAICHAKVLEAYALPGQVIVGSDSHTPHAGAVGCVAFGVGSTAIANAWLTRDVRVTVPPTLRVELAGRARPGVTAKDVMLELLRHPHVRAGGAVGQIVEYTGSAVAAFSVDERATLTNMAAEVGAFTGLVAPDDRTVDFLVRQRGVSHDEARRLCAGLAADPGAAYAGTIRIDASALRPMVALPGDPGNGRPVDELGDVRIDIAYAGSCTAGKQDDMDMYAAVFADALARGARVAAGVRCFVQCGSQDVFAYCVARGYDRLFAAVGAELIAPSCGACINAGPGVSRAASEVTVSAINRNFPGRSGPGRLYLASPYTVAASAVAGRIVAWEPAGAALFPPVPAAQYP